MAVCKDGTFVKFLHYVAIRSSVMVPFCLSAVISIILDPLTAFGLKLHEEPCSKFELSVTVLNT